SWGNFYDGRNTELSLNATWRAGGHLIMNGDVQRNTALVHAGRFTATQAAAQIELAFSTRSDLLGFFQYNNDSKRVDTQLRFHWIPVIGDDVFVVWGSGYTTAPTARFRFPRAAAFTRPLEGALTLKVVHRFAR